MSTKFEQLLDYLVNENMEKANELFHEIVVEKSRSIYENLIAEEDDEMEDEDYEMSESEEDLEDSYSMEADDEEDGMSRHDAGDDLGLDTMDLDGEEDDMDDMDDEGGEDDAMLDIKNAIEELEAAFAELEAAQSKEHGDMDMDADSEFGDDDMSDDDSDEEDEMEMMGMPMENRRMTREYVEKVNHNYGGNTQKTDGDYAGAGTGETQSKPVNGKSPISSGKGKPTTGATAGNILGDKGTGKGKNSGTSPDSLNKGIAQVGGEKFANGNGNVPGGKMGVKNLKKVGSGYPGNNKSAGPVGSGTGDKAGQTSVSSDKPFLKKL